MTSIIDTIDQAIADHETSVDAMRWTPEPPPLPVGPCRCLVQPVTNISITSEQVAAFQERLFRGIQPAVAALARAHLSAMRRLAQDIRDANRAEQRR